MPKRDVVRRVDLKTSGTGAGFVGGGGGGSTSGVTDHGALTGLADDDHTQYFNQARGDARYILSTRTIATSGSLSGGGDLSADRTFALQTPGSLTATSSNDASVAAHTHAIDSTIARSAITVTGTGALGGGGNLTANRTLTMNTPGDLSVSSTSAASTNHTHAITASDSVSSAQTSLLKATNGALGLDTLTLATKVRTPLIDTASGALTLDAAGDLITIGASNNVRRTGYVSQATGWAIDYNGGADFRYVYADEMHVKAFIADLEQALAGGQIISKSVTSLAYDWTVPAAGDTVYIYVRDLPSAPNMAVFETGDFIRLRQFSRSGGGLTVGNVWGAVSGFTADTGPGGATVNGVQRWNFQRSTGGDAGGVSAGGTIEADSLVLDYGVSGAGYYEVNAIDGTYGANSPYMQIRTWTTHPNSGQVTRQRHGNLNGITGLTGKWGSYYRGGIWIHDSNGNEKIVLDDSGAAYIAGALTLGTSGGIYQGSGTFSSPTTGLKLWNDSGTGRIAGYNGGTFQVGFDTNGKFVAGAGKATLDADGLTFNVSDTYGYMRVVDSAATYPERVRWLNWTMLSNTLTMAQWQALGGGSVVASVNMTASDLGVGAVSLSALGASGAIALSATSTTVSGTLGVAGTTTIDAGLTVTRGSLTQSLTRTLNVGGARNTSGTDFAQLIFRNYDSNNSAVDYDAAMITSQNVGAADSGDLRFHTKATADGGTVERWRMDTSGNLIGTGSMYAGGEGGGISGKVGITNHTQGVSSGTGTVKMNGATNRNSTGWIKVYDGTNVRYIPFWTDVTG